MCPPTLSQAHPVVKSWLRHCLKVKVKNKFHFLSARVAPHSSSPSIPHCNIARQRQGYLFLDVLGTCLQRETLRKGEEMWLKVCPGNDSVATRVRDGIWIYGVAVTMDIYISIQSTRLMRQRWVTLFVQVAYVLAYVCFLPDFDALQEKSTCGMVWCGSMNWMVWLNADYPTI